MEPEAQRVWDIVLRAQQVGAMWKAQGEAGSQRALEAVVRRPDFILRAKGASALSRRVTRSHLFWLPWRTVLGDERDCRGHPSGRTL